VSKSKVRIGETIRFPGLRDCPPGGYVPRVGQYLHLVAGNGNFHARVVVIEEDRSEVEVIAPCGARVPEVCKWGAPS
jgi:hypothetical protein